MWLSARLWGQEIEQDNEDKFIAFRLKLEGSVTFFYSGARPKIADPVKRRRPQWTHRHFFHRTPNFAVAMRCDIWQVRGKKMVGWRTANAALICVEYFLACKRHLSTLTRSENRRRLVVTDGIKPSTSHFALAHVMSFIVFVQKTPIISKDNGQKYACLEGWLIWKDFLSAHSGTTLWLIIISHGEKPPSTTSIAF